MVALRSKVPILNFWPWCDQIPLLHICSWSTIVESSNEFWIRTFNHSATKMVQKTWQVTPCITVRKFWQEIVALWSYIPIRNFQLWYNQMHIMPILVNMAFGHTMVKSPNLNFWPWWVHFPLEFSTCGARFFEPLMNETKQLTKSKRYGDFGQAG